MPKGNTGAKFSLSVNRQTSIPCNFTLLPPEIHTEYTRPKERLERMAATLSKYLARLDIFNSRINYYNNELY